VRTSRQAKAEAGSSGAWPLPDKASRLPSAEGTKTSREALDRTTIEPVSLVRSSSPAIRPTASAAPEMTSDDAKAYANCGDAADDAKRVNASVGGSSRSWSAAQANKAGDVRAVFTRKFAKRRRQVDRAGNGPSATRDHRNPLKRRSGRR